MKALLDSDIWADTAFESLSSEAKLVVFWLWTCPQRDSAGVVRVSERRLAFDTGVNNPSEALKEALGSGSYRRFGERVVILGWIKRQVGECEKALRNNTTKGIAKALLSHCEEIQSCVVERYPWMAKLLQKTPTKTDPTQALGKGLGSTKEGKVKEGKVKKGESEGEPIPPGMSPAAAEAAVDLEAQPSPPSLAELRAKVLACHPDWATRKHLNASEERALMDALPALADASDDDWRALSDWHRIKPREGEELFHFGLGGFLEAFPKPVDSARNFFRKAGNHKRRPGYKRSPAPIATLPAEPELSHGEQLAELERAVAQAEGLGRPKAVKLAKTALEEFKNQHLQESA